MLNPLEMMKLVPRAKKLIALLNAAIDENDANVIKYKITPKDTIHGNAFKIELMDIMNKDKQNTK